MRIKRNIISICITLVVIAAIVIPVFAQSVTNPNPDGGTIKAQIDKLLADYQKALDNEISNGETKIANDSLGNSMRLGDFSRLNFSQLSFMISKYFSLSKQVWQTKEYLLNKYKLDLDNTIAVCYRGNDHVKESHPPTYDEMMAKFQEIRINFPYHKILVQSDEANFYNCMQNKFRDIISFNEVCKISHNPNLLVSDVIPIGHRTYQAK